MRKGAAWRPAESIHLLNGTKPTATRQVAGVPERLRLIVFTNLTDVTLHREGLISCIPECLPLWLTAAPIKPSLVDSIVPLALEVGDGRLLFILRQLILECRHFPPHGDTPFIDGTHQHIERMVPGVG